MLWLLVDLVCKTFIFKYYCIFQNSKLPGLKGICEFMLEETSRKFDYLFNEANPKFDATFLLATAMGPNLRMFITSEQTSILRRHIVKIMRQLVRKDRIINAPYCLNSTSLSDCQPHSTFVTEPMSTYHDITHHIELPLISKMCQPTKLPSHDSQLTPCVA